MCAIEPKIRPPSRVTKGPEVSGDVRRSLPDPNESLALLRAFVNIEDGDVRADILRIVLERATPIALRSERRLTDLDSRRLYERR